jgi:hypothetical protein
MQLDMEFERGNAMRKYWKRNDFDIVRCSFNHPELEERRLRCVSSALLQIPSLPDSSLRNSEMQSAKRKMVSSSVKRKPNCVQNSEGRLYNIINTIPIDAQRLERRDRMDDKRRSRMRLRHSFENQVRVGQ